MSDAGDSNTTVERLLQAVNAGQAGATDRLAEAVHDQLRAMARRHLVKDFGPGLGGVTIQPTMLADDTLLKLLQQRQRFDTAGHFFAIASRLMMRVLLDYHRERKAQKRGAGAVRLSLSPDVDPPARSSNDDVDVEALHNALDQLAAMDARKADVVRYRVLWGFTAEQTAAALAVGLATVERDWAFAKAWLAKELTCRD
jgi:RNA polymerase sigma factor (TIGR02999 family)